MLGCCWDGWSGDEDAGPHLLPGEPDRSPGRGRIVGAGRGGCWALGAHPPPIPSYFSRGCSAEKPSWGSPWSCQAVPVRGWIFCAPPPPPAHPAPCWGLLPDLGVQDWGTRASLGFSHPGVLPCASAWVRESRPGTGRGRSPRATDSWGGTGGTQVLAEGLTPLRSQLMPHQRPCLSFPTVHIPTVSQQVGPLLGWGKDARGYVVVSLAPQIRGDHPRKPFPGLSIQPCGCPKFPLAPLGAAARQEKARQPPQSPDK